jgi:hypothetical protein
LLAPSIFSPTPATADPSAFQLSQEQNWMIRSAADEPASDPVVLIPVTGADFSSGQNEKQRMVSRVHQMQTGLNFLGLGLILMGIASMSGKKASGHKKVR